MHTLDASVVKAIFSRGCNGDSSIPEIPPHAISTVAKILVVDGTLKPSRHDWKMEQQTDPDIGPIVTLITNRAILQYVEKEGDSSGMRVLLKRQKDLVMKEGLLYRSFVERT